MRCWFLTCTTSLTEGALPRASHNRLSQQKEISSRGGSLGSATASWIWAECLSMLDIVKIWVMRWVVPTIDLSYTRRSFHVLKSFQDPLYFTFSTILLRYSEFKSYVLSAFCNGSIYCMRTWREEPSIWTIFCIYFFTEDTSNRRGKTVLMTQMQFLKKCKISRFLLFSSLSEGEFRPCPAGRQDKGGIGRAEI